MRLAVTGLLAALVAAAAPPPPATSQTEYVQAVEFPYYLYPRPLWERELVWLKTIGVRTVEFSIPWNWHQLQPGEFDFTGRTSPRRDLTGLIRILRRLELRAWIRPMPPVPGWLDNGWPGGIPDSRGQRQWAAALERLLLTQTQKHGGPIVFVEGRELAIEASAPPYPVVSVQAGDSGALLRSREAIGSGHGSLLWRGVEESLYPAGWELAGAPLLRPGAVDFSGTELPPTGVLRREAALLLSWAAFLPDLHPVALPKPAAGKFPKGVMGTELISPSLSAVSLMNRGETPFQDELRVLDPDSKRVLVIPSVSVPAGGALWLPLYVSLGQKGLCAQCTNFSGAERVVYATAELQAIEFENGILAMEFAAPHPGEVILQLEREPEGPYLAAGKPTKFEWDEKTLRARLPIPSSTAPGNRVRVGLAIEAPETSGFFTEAHRLVIGQKNLVSTVYSSADVAARSRLLAPEGFTAAPVVKSPNEIDYTVSVPPEALHGDFAPLVLEADGAPLGRARLQLFRPASIRLSNAIQLHFGTQAALTADPPTVPIEPRTGSNVEIVIRNNSPSIQTYRLQPVGDGLEFSPPKTQISIGAMDERPVSFRVFGKEGASGLQNWHLRVGGGAELDLPFRAILVPRTGTIAWSADLDGGGSPEWVLESQKARAVFSSRDGGRWMEFTWKDTSANFLPVDGALAQPGAVEVQPKGDALQFRGAGWTRTVSLSDARLTVEQSMPLPPEAITNRTAGNLFLSIDRPSAERVVYGIMQSEP